MKKSAKIIGIVLLLAVFAATLVLAISADTPSYVAKVDGVGYFTEEDATAAIRDGSSVEILQNFNKNIEKSGVGFTVSLGGFTVPGIVSETHKLIKEGESLSLVPAASDEIFTVSFEYDGICASSKAALGTSLKAPEAFDVYPKFNPETEEYTVLDFAVNGGTVVSGNAVATPVVSTTPAVKIVWCDENGTEELDTDYYYPGEKTSLPEFSGTDIPDDVSPEWYSNGRVSWNEADVSAATAGLSVGGEYKIRAVMGRKAPDEIPGLKLNLTLHSNYILNFYVPENVPGVSDVSIATTPDGSATLAKLESGTIEGARYSKFSYLFGAADTSIIKFYVLYSYEGERFSYEIEYGVPVYAAGVMQQLPCDAVLAKTLVINIANYADKVLTLSGGDKTTLGARAYAKLLQLYGEDYLGFYNSLSNEKFLEGGEIYVNDGVSGTKLGAAMQYVDALSFNFDTYAPAFLLRPSSAALATDGFKVFVKYGDAEFSEAAYSDEGGYYVSFLGRYYDKQESFSASRLKDKITFEFRSGDSVLGCVDYNLASYINSMLGAAAENEAAITAAKAIYAFSYAAYDYVSRAESENEGLPCLDFDGDHKCDDCGKQISYCYDETHDHICDVCAVKLSKLCRDANKDFVCDVCGDSTTYKYVVVIGVDGGGAFFKDTETPNLDRIFANGAVSYDTRTEIPSISAQNWGSILHGVKAGVHGCTNTNTLQGNNNGVIDTTVNRFPKDSDIPSFLRVIKEAWPDADVASITNWANISYGMVEDGLGIYMPYLDTDANNTDRDVTDTILSYVNSCDPTALFVQFNEVDTMGHRYGYGTDEHLSRITTIDGYIGEIYDAYAEKGLLDETLFIVTADHGGTPTKPGGVVGGEHGGTTDAEMHVMFAATGKTVIAGEIGDMEVRDTAAVVLYALGLNAPITYTARVPSGIFGGVEAPAERPSYVNPDSDRYHETEGTPSVDSDKFISNEIPDKNILHYFPFDGDTSELVGGLTAEEVLKITYKDAYFGKGINLESGYVSIPEFSFGENSFTVATWIDTRGAAPDPVIFGNKDWGAGKNYGMVLVINQSGKLTLNVGNGESRYDFAVDLPKDYRDGWMHLMLSIDKENSKVRIIIDFEEVYEKSINATMLDVIYATTFLNLGQDGTGEYYPLTATLDEFMIFDGILNSDEIASFAEYYGQKVDTIRNQESKETPDENSDAYIGNYVDKYIGDELVLYLPFDQSLNAALGQNATASGTLTYEEGFFGEALRIKDGAYASVDGIELGTGSYTFSFWLKQESAQHDPVILATKNWSGAQKGFLIASKIYNGTPQFTANFGNGSSRADVSVNAPGDFTEGWMHMTLVIDKTSNTAYLYVDFELIKTLDITIFANESVTQSAKLVIGQQLNGSYEDKLDAAIDELMVFGGALDENGVRALSKYYGVEKLAYGNIVEIPEIEVIPDATIRDHINVDTPTKNDTGYIGNYVTSDKNLIVYLPFDGSLDAVTGQSTSASGTLTYEEGFFGEALRIKDGAYASVDGIELGTGSYTFSFWLKQESAQHDPVILATKNWSGAQKGFLIASKIYNGTPQFTANFGNGSSRADVSVNAPGDFTEGWMHMTLVIDKTSNTAYLYVDFELIKTVDISIFADESVTQSAKLVIGQQLNGNYEDKLDAAIDELMVFEGAFDATDTRALAKYFGVEKAAFGDVVEIDGLGEGSVIVQKNATVRNPNPLLDNVTPDKESGKYVTDFIDKELELYVNFDGESASTATGQGFEATAGNGSYSYESGVFGNSLTIKDGAYATVSDITLGAGSYTFSFWIKMDAAPSGDPAIISTKDWNSGAAAGFIICTKTYSSYTQTVATLVNGTSSDRVNCSYNNPTDCHSGWTHVTVVIDKENKMMYMYYDFVLAKSIALNDNLLDQTITQTSGNYADILRIGQDLEANYGKVLNASIDELMVFGGAMSADEVRALSAYYGLENVVFGN